METYKKDHDTKVFCITAKSFPAGVKEAHQKLHSLLPPVSGREYFGISFMNHGEIIYKAAVGLKKDEEAQKLNLETFTIRKGTYIGKILTNFMEDIPAIGNTFQLLLKDSRIDPAGYCLEEYFDDNNVRCLVKLKDD